MSDFTKGLAVGAGPSFGATATADKVLEGFTFVANGVLVTGTMPDMFPEIALELTVPGLPDVSESAVCPPLYQEWEGAVTDSPVLTSEYPYQALLINPSNTTEYTLIVATDKLYYNSSLNRLYSLSGSVISRNFFSYWRDPETNTYYNPVMNGREFSEANNDVYTDATVTTVYFSKTTL